MSMTTAFYQEVVAGLVALRGYRKGYAARAYTARQVLKAVEEAAEAASVLGAVLPEPFSRALAAVGEDARVHFDAGWPGGVLFEDVDWEALLGELADLQVVLFVAAEALGEFLGREVDLVALAVEKAKADVARGVRGEEGAR